MIEDGLSEEEARSRFFIVGRQGPFHDGMAGLRDFRKLFVQPHAALADWAGGDGTSFSLEEILRNVKPGIMVGVSKVPGPFTEQVVNEMALHFERPITFFALQPTVQPIQNESPVEVAVAGSKGSTLRADHLYTRYHGNSKIKVTACELCPNTGT